MNVREAVAALQALPEEQQDAPLVIFHAGLLQSVLRFWPVAPWTHNNPMLCVQCSTWLPPTAAGGPSPPAAQPPKK